jgi:hypothetical protein
VDASAADQPLSLQSVAKPPDRMASLTVRRDFLYTQTVRMNEFLRRIGCDDAGTR